MMTKKSNSKSIIGLVLLIGDYQKVVYSMANSQLTQPYYYVERDSLTAVIAMSLYLFGVKNYSLPTDIIKKACDEFIRLKEQNNPRKILFVFKDSNSYKKEFNRYLEIYVKYKDSNVERIEKEIFAFTLVGGHYKAPYSITKKGKPFWIPRTEFRTKGILNELVWIWEQFANGVKKQDLILYYLGLGEDHIKNNGYPHA